MFTTLQNLYVTLFYNLTLASTPVGDLSGSEAQSAGGGLSDQANEVLTWFMWAGLVICIGVIIAGIILLVLRSGNPQGRSAGIVMIIVAGIGALLLYNVSDVYNFFIP